MKKMRVSLAIVPFLVFAACSTYTVKNVIKKSAAKSLKSSAVIVRVGTSSFVKSADYSKDLTSWLSGYKKMNKLEVLPSVDDKLGIYDTTNRFYQVGASKEFLKYKSIGTITNYINANREALKKILSTKNLDSIIFYEVDSVYSAEMFFIDFASLIVILDKNLNIIYLDHQNDFFSNVDVDGGDKAKMIKETLNTVSKRFIEEMKNLDYMKEM